MLHMNFELPVKILNECLCLYAHKFATFYSQLNGKNTYPSKITATQVSIQSDENLKIKQKKTTKTEVERNTEITFLFKRMSEFLYC